MSERIDCSIRNKAANVISATREQFEGKIDVPGLVSDESVLRFLENLEEVVRGKNKE